MRHSSQERCYHPITFSYQADGKGARPAGLVAHTFSRRHQGYLPDDWFNG